MDLILHQPVVFLVQVAYLLVHSRHLFSDCLHVLHFLQVFDPDLLVTFFSVQEVPAINANLAEDKTFCLMD